MSTTEQPNTQRGARKVRQGYVVSDKMDKTVVVRVDRRTTHPLYRKTITQSKRYHAHDETNDVKVGDLVRIAETRPLSRTKRWRVVEVVERAK
jgi:small subunit ribosomal protein S17